MFPELWGMLLGAAIVIFWYSLMLGYMFFLIKKELDLVTKTFKQITSEYCTSSIVWEQEVADVMNEMEDRGVFEEGDNHAN